MIARYPPEAFAWRGWDLAREESIFRMVLPFLKG